jgi:Na+-transporting methylmalonyl-CoA/oxaloacetate decarboxylase gamma subunit
MHTNDHDRDFDNAQLEPPVDSEHPGYETTDVNATGVAVFLAGLFGFVLIFFVFCYGMGKVINTAIGKQDGPPDKWHPASVMEGAPGPDGKRQDMTSNAEMQQKELQQMTSSFPTPRLDIDDGNQATADLHAREDLLLEHYSSDPGEPGTIRIPIVRAMELIAQRGLPVASEGPAAPLMAGDAKPVIQAPLTTGFARTGYELDVMEARKQRLSYSNAEEATHAELAPIK